MTRMFWMPGIVLVLVVVCWNCKSDVTSSSVDSIVFPAKNVSYSKQMQPLFNSGCGGQNSQCHGMDSFVQTGFSLDGYDHLMGGSQTIVVPGDSVGSVLVLSIEGRGNHSIMPPIDFPALTANQIQGIKQWIIEGAKNN